MAKPLLLAVGDDAQTLAALESDLGRRFGADYRIVATAAPSAALDMLDTGDEVALLIADQRLSDLTGVDFLCRAHEVQPAAATPPHRLRRRRRW